jgi:cell division GTPase FtsZ
MFKVFGLGQCGTRIGLVFEKMGIDVSYINSDAGDVRGLNLKGKCLQIDTAGTGGSPIKGREMVQKHKKDFESFIKKHADPNKINLVIAGAGGGTGGGIVAPTLEMLHVFGFKTGCLLTLPPKLLGILANDNAMRTLKEVKAIKLDFFSIADNEFLSESNEIKSDWWKDINEQIVYTLLSPYAILTEGKTTKTGFGSIDLAEVNRIMQYGEGLIDIRIVSFDKKEIANMEDKDIKKKLFAPCLVEGYEYKNSLAYMASIDVPEKGDFNSFAYRVLAISQKAAGSSIARVGTFTDKSLKDVVRVTVVNTGLKLPKIMQSRVNNLKRDNQRMRDKMGKVESIDLDIEDSIVKQDF